MDHIEKAILNHVSGYNCSQAVACAFSDLTDLDARLMFQLTEGFGIGMGCMEGTCGAISGAVCVASLLAAKDQNSRGKSYAMSRQIVKAFLDKNKSVICKELKGIETGKALRDCPGCVKDAAAILEKVLSAHEYLDKPDRGDA